MAKFLDMCETVILVFIVYISSDIWMKLLRLASS